MTRKEQIEKEADAEGRVYSEGTIQAFKAGAEWADAHPDQEILNLRADLEWASDLEAKLSIAVDALEQYVKCNIPSAPGDYFSADGGSIAYEALAKIKGDK